MLRIVGFGLSFSQNAAPLLLIELSYPTQVGFRKLCDICRPIFLKQRGKFTAIFNSCWYLGSIISAWVFVVSFRNCAVANRCLKVCYGAYVQAGNSMWSWRLPTILQAFLPAIQIVSLWFIPESPRWLVSTGRV